MTWGQVGALIVGFAAVLMGVGYFWFVVYREAYPYDLYHSNKLAQCANEDPKFNRWSGYDRAMCYLN